MGLERPGAPDGCPCRLQSFLRLAPDSAPCRLGCYGSFAERSAEGVSAASRDDTNVSFGTRWLLTTAEGPNLAAGQDACALPCDCCSAQAILSECHMLPADHPRVHAARVVGAASGTPAVLSERGGSDGAQDRDRPGHCCSRADPLEHAPARDRVANLGLELVHGTSLLPEALQASAVALPEDSLSERIFLTHPETGCNSQYVWLAFTRRLDESGIRGRWAERGRPTTTRDGECVRDDQAGAAKPSPLPHPRCGEGSAVRVH